MIDVRLIDDLGELEALAGAWDALWRRSPIATPFQSPAWLIAWQRVFAPGDLRCAAAFADGQLAALLPFYLERGRLGRRLMPMGVSISDYLDILVDPRRPEAAHAAVALLFETEWEEWRLENLAPGAEALRLELPPGADETCFEQEVCPVIALQGDNLSACVPARQRRKQRRALAAAQRLGAVARESEWPADAFLDLLFALHRERWERRGERGVLDDARVQAFHRAALPGLQAAGAARTLALTIGGRPVAAYYGFAWRSRAYAYLGGFDPSFEEASP